MNMVNMSLKKHFYYTQKLKINKNTINTIKFWEINFISMNLHLTTYSKQDLNKDLFKII